MEHSIDTETRASHWKQLYFFKVFSEERSHIQHGDSPLFNNGVQQLKITIQLAALNAGGHAVQLTQAELDTVCLIDYTTSTEIPYWWGASGPWITTTNHWGFVWDRSFFERVRVAQKDHPEGFEAPSAEVMGASVADGEIVTILQTPNMMAVTGKTMAFTEDQKALLKEVHPGIEPSSYQLVELYLSTDSGSSRQFAARAVNGDGTVFRTNYLEIGNDSGLGDGHGKFHSSVRVQSVTFPVLSNDSYGDRLSNGALLKEHIGQWFFYSPAWFSARIEETHINIRLPGGYMVPIRELFHDNNLAVWADANSTVPTMRGTYLGSPIFGYIVYYTPPYFGVSGRYVPFNLPVDEKIGHRPQLPREGQIVIGIVSTENHYWYYSSGSRAHSKVRQVFRVRDIYGNMHPLALALRTDNQDITLTRA
ncbi:hypothetical protein [Pseudomonas sp. dw_358]|uniref:hypothetical protein n=1 Tax=Pseudomonas sp. dw_358 TaxID=2720083 RepID=UPI001BD27BD4|nr:hypothetical protein [Pseudomonas sp. dw_358]